MAMTIKELIHNDAVRRAIIFVYRIGGVSLLPNAGNPRKSNSSDRPL